MQTDLLPVILTIAVSILTVTLVVIAVYVVQVLVQVKRTLERVNTTLDMAESKINGIISPFQSIAGMSSSIGAGLKVFESFTRWLNRKQETHERSE